MVNNFQLDLNYPKGYDSVAISNVKDLDSAKETEKRKANEKLFLISREAIKVNDTFTDNVFTINALYKIRKAFPDVDGGYLRQRAYNTLKHIETNEPLLKAVEVEESRITEKLCSLGKSKPSDGLTPDQIATFARRVLNNETKEKTLYIAENKENENEISIGISIIDFEKYNALKNIKKEKFEGFTFNIHELQKAYKEFLQIYLENKNKISDRELIRFASIIRALKTDTYVVKEDNIAVEDLEDIDFFDLSGDGLLNRGDVSAMDLILLSETNPKIKSALSKSTQDNWNDLTYLKEISNLPNEKTTINLFDLNGDKSIDETDFNLYQKIKEEFVMENPNKFDINNDGFINKKDAEIINEYFKAMLAKIKNAKDYMQNTIEITGGQDKLDTLKKHFEQNR